MQELEKILEEIDIKIAGSMGKKREGILEAQEIIRKHMNDGWIPENKQPETCKYTGGSCCWPIDQCSDCPNHPERGERE